MNTTTCAMLETLAERISLRDLAALAGLRRDLAALDTGIAALEREEAAEIAAAGTGDPATRLALSAFRKASAVRRDALQLRRAALAAKETAAHEAAIRALGRARAVSILRRRAETAARAARERRAERALSLMR